MKEWLDVQLWNAFKPSHVNWHVNAFLQALQHL